MIPSNIIASTGFVVHSSKTVLLFITSVFP